MSGIRRRSGWLACVLFLTACAGAKNAPDFSLQDDRGNPWTLSAQRGKAVLLTFGFTHCRDTCPATLAKLSRLRDSLQDPARVEIALVTVDPRRDTVAVMHRFVAHFSPASKPVVGLTGSPREIAGVESAYHVWSQGVRGGDIAHTAVIFFIAPNGRLAGERNDGESDTALARAMAALLTS